MKYGKSIISNKIDIFNKAVKKSMLLEDSAEIIKNFAETGIKVMEADFGYAWWKPSLSDEHQLVFKSSNTPFTPVPGEPGANCLAIPIQYGDHVYGSIVVGFKKKHDFLEEEEALSQIIGSVTAQAVTVPWLIENERKALVLAEKQKEIEVLLDQEKLKTEFIENATHELRTPLAIMKGNVDLALMEKEEFKSYRKVLMAINEEIKTLSDILGSLTLLTASGKNAKQMVERKQVDVFEMVAKIALRLKTIAKEKNIKIETKTKGSEEALVAGDKMYLEKLFFNLIKNAVAYGRDSGHVDIRLSKDKDTVKVEIEDDGIGISKEDMPRIFERFYRADKSHSSGGAHFGLGLSIVKWALDIHGGSIDVKSAHGKGSTFTVALPLADAK